MARKRERIDTSGGEALAANNPFARLSGEGLKPGSPPEAGTPLSQTTHGTRRTSLHLRRLKAGKGGKVVTEITGFDQAEDEVEQLLKQLKSRLATGGTRRGTTIELQGERRQEVKVLLESEGYRVKGF